LIVAQDRQMAIDLIAEAVVAGARRHKACAVLEIAVRTLQRWQKTLQEENTLTDHRQAAAAGRTPANKLSEAERQAILGICHHPEFRSLPPSQIVPRLADEGVYVGSESSFYRVLHEAGQVNRRGRAKAPRSVAKPEGFQAMGPNQVWSWDITFLASAIRGTFHRLYLVEDIFSRKIVGWEVHEDESADHASVLIRKACLAEGIRQQGLVLHADNAGQ
jgi:putative transposase